MPARKTHVIMAASVGRPVGFRVYGVRGLYGLKGLGFRGL